LALGPLETNCYVCRAGEHAWVVDPGLWPRPLLQFLREQKIEPEAIVLTHGHGDHIAGAGAVMEEFGRPKLLCPAGDAGMLTDPQANLSAPFGMPMTCPPADELFHPGDTLTLGELAWQVLDTSGHTPGGVSLHCAAERIVITGDALFAGSVGRSDIPGADGARLVRNIWEQLLTLPDDTRVLAGHGGETTIGRERASNYYLIHHRQS
jgi:glyoxylase-like metal-dependent hydrolase (beta-lactamase superfamily II)